MNKLSENITNHYIFLMDQFYEDVTLNAVNFADMKEVRNVQFNNCVITNTSLFEKSIINCVFDDCQFQNIDLSMCKLSDTQLDRVTFKDCKMMGINFSHCKQLIFNVNFNNCILDFCSFEKIKMQNTEFVDCSMKGVDFTNTNLEKSKFENSDLSDAVFSEPI